MKKSINKMNVGSWIITGFIVGMLFGTAINNIMFGVSIGMCIGIIIGSLIDLKNKKSSQGDRNEK